MNPELLRALASTIERHQALKEELVTVKREISVLSRALGLDAPEVETAVETSAVEALVPEPLPALKPVKKNQVREDARRIREWIRGRAMKSPFSRITAKAAFPEMENFGREFSIAVKTMMMTSELKPLGGNPAQYARVRRLRKL